MYIMYNTIIYYSVVSVKSMGTSFSKISVVDVPKLLGSLYRISRASLDSISSNSVSEFSLFVNSFGTSGFKDWGVDV